MGFVDVAAYVRKRAFPIETVEGWVEFFFEWRNPVCEGLMGPFFESHKGLRREEVKEVFRRVVREEWDWGKNVGMEYILAVGRKQA